MFIIAPIVAIGKCQFIEMRRTILVLGIGIHVCPPGDKEEWEEEGGGKPS